MMDTIQKAFELAGGSEGLSALFLTGLIALWYSKFEKKAESGYLFWYSLAVLILVINPIYYYLIIKYLPELAEHNMMLWVLPTTPVIMYVCVSATSYAKKRIDRIVFGFAMVVILILAGTTSYHGNTYRIVTNSYYIPESELEMLTLVEDYQTHCGKEQILLWGDQNVMLYARSYSGDINLLYGKDLWLGSQDSQLHQIYEEDMLKAYQQMEHAPFFLSEIGNKAKEEGCDVLVFTQKDFEVSGIAIPERITGGYVQYTASTQYVMFVRND